MIYYSNINDLSYAKLKFINYPYTTKQKITLKNRKEIFMYVQLVTKYIYDYDLTEQDLIYLNEIFNEAKFNSVVIFTDNEDKILKCNLNIKKYKGYENIDITILPREKFFSKKIMDKLSGDVYTINNNGFSCTSDFSLNILIDDCKEIELISQNIELANLCPNIYLFTNDFNKLEDIINKLELYRGELDEYKYS